MPHGEGIIVMILIVKVFRISARAQITNPKRTGIVDAVKYGNLY